MTCNLLPYLRSTTQEERPSDFQNIWQNVPLFIFDLTFLKSRSAHPIEVRCPYTLRLILQPVADAIHFSEATAPATKVGTDNRSPQPICHSYFKLNKNQGRYIPDINCVIRNIPSPGITALNAYHNLQKNIISAEYHYFCPFC